MNVIAAVKTILTTAGITTPIKLAIQPDAPQTVITILDTGGAPPLSEIPALQFPTFQLLIRADNYDNGKAICDQCRAALHGKIAVQAEDVHFLFIELLAEFGDIGQNARGDQEFSGNFKSEVRQILS